MILGFTKHAWGKYNEFIKLGGGEMGSIGENLGKAKRLRFFFFFLIFFHGFFFLLWGFNKYKE
jgi:hypothetical protein